MGFFSQAIQNGAKHELTRPKTRYKKPKAESEHAIQDAIMDFLFKNGYIVVRIHSSMLCSEQTHSPVRSYLIYGLGMSSGLSDLIAFKQGKTLLIEVKSKIGKLSENQKKVKEHFETKGIPYHVCKSVEDVRSII